MKSPDFNASCPAVYAACKGGLVAFSKTLAREHAARGRSVLLTCTLVLYALYRRVSKAELSLG